MLHKLLKDSLVVLGRWLSPASPSALRSVASITDMIVSLLMALAVPQCPPIELGVEL
jgi:hypothetical protein